jgi:hypothetical protein
MSLKLEVNFPTTKTLTNDEQVEVIWAVYNAIRVKVANGELEHLGLTRPPTVQGYSSVEH